MIIVIAMEWSVLSPKYIFIYVWLVFNPIFSAQLNELFTVGLLKDSLMNVEVFQRVYATQDEWVFQRDQLLSFPLGRQVEFGLNLSNVNYLKRTSKAPTRFGDIKLFLNIATDWLQEYITLNYYLEFNTGSGPDYTNLNNHPLEAYGHEEWRTGLLFFKNFPKIFIALHGNLFYVFRSEGEPTFFGSFFNQDVLNIFSEEAYNRGLGFNPVHKETFFYYKNFTNDNIEFNLGINTEIWYPFIPFLEMTTSFVFTDNFRRKTIGSGIMKNQLSVGLKFFLENNHFSYKLLLIVPIANLNQLYDIGWGFGFQLKF